MDELTTKPGSSLLEVDGLEVGLTSRGREVALVDNVSFTVRAGETYGLVGQSGSGKSVTAMTIMGLTRVPGMTIRGSAKLAGRELLGLSARQRTRISGNQIGMVFQDPMSSLNPAYTVGEQIAETLRRHRGLSRRAAAQRAVELLRLVEIPHAEKRARAYPHEFSGGMRQRVMIAIAVSCNPQVLIADEATTALDVTVQRQILDLLRRLQEESGMGMLFITHDLSVLADIADTVGVMYAGQIVEEASVLDVFEKTRHPYTADLLRSSPEFLVLSASARSVRHQEIAETGCRFRPRCEYAEPACSGDVVLRSTASCDPHHVRCVRADELRLPTAGDLWRQVNEHDASRAERSPA